MAIPTGTPLTGASNAGGVGRNRDSELISGFTACCERMREASLRQQSYLFGLLRIYTRHSFQLNTTNI